MTDQGRESAATRAAHAAERAAARSSARFKRAAAAPQPEGFDGRLDALARDLREAEEALERREAAKRGEGEAYGGAVRAVAARGGPPSLVSITASAGSLRELSDADAALAIGAAATRALADVLRKG